MYAIDNESLERWKIAFAKSGVNYQTSEEYYDAIHNFTSFIDTLIEIDKNVKQDEAAGMKRKGKVYLSDKDSNKIIL